jgi:hypothetical protein
MNALKECKEDWDEGKRSFDALVQTVAQCVEKGYFTGMDPENLAFTFWAMAHGVCSLEIRERCAVLTEEKQKGLTDRAAAIITEMLEKMHKK